MQIAERLKTSRQFVHLTLNACDVKISNLLTDLARVNRLEIEHLDVRNGILAGFSPSLRTQAIVSYSVKHGAQVWYWEENPNACGECDQATRCMEYLLNEAEERGISLTQSEMQLPPSRLGRVIFSTLVPGLRP